ncbi:MAG TPA: D-2-hydroxyacid dehydrogenase [Opitutaceae bacterium]|nr:D-2-hydroxyacid dehydrogenase [Opitutaceae bacterium]HRJ47045.1 D-2-hydroxyacid dehydrogenase [Opitutaceae bacterium]
MNAISPPAKILFRKDVSYHPTVAEMCALREAHPGVEIVEAFGCEAGAEPDLGDVTILVTDLDVPRDLRACPRLKWIQLVSAGANQVTNTAIADSDILVTSASGLHGVPIAQFVTGNLLMLAHCLPQLGEIQKSRHWPAARWELRGSVLRSKTAGILGYGSIGRECARQLHALGLRIVALDPGPRRDDGYNYWPGTGDPAGALPDRWFQPAELPAMMRECDVLVVAAPYTPRTAGMVGRAELELMKPGGRVIIISRGGIVRERALADALADGKLAGAAVDCFEQEPPPSGHFFYDTPNLIMTPHMAGAFEGFWPALLELFTENLRRFHAGRPLHNQTNKRLGY